MAGNGQIMTKNRDSPGILDILPEAIEAGPVFTQFRHPDAEV